MNFTEIVEEVLDNLGNPDDAGELLTLAQNKVNFVITEDLHTRGLPYYDSTATFSTVASQEYVAVPEGFVRAQNVFLKASGETDYGRPLGIFELPETRDMATDRPTKFRVMYNATLAALGVHFRPIPDAVYSGKIYYARRETALSGTQTAIIAAIYGDMPIIAGATYWSAVNLRRLDLAAMWQAEYNRTIAAMCEWLRDRQGGIYEEPGLYGQQDELSYRDRYSP